MIHLDDLCILEFPYQCYASPLLMAANQSSYMSTWWHTDHLSHHLSTWAISNSSNSAVGSCFLFFCGFHSSLRDKCLVFPTPSLWIYQKYILYKWKNHISLYKLHFVVPVYSLNTWKWTDFMSHFFQWSISRPKDSSHACLNSLETH